MHYLTNIRSAKVRSIAASVVAALVVVALGLTCVACSEPVENRQVRFEMNLDGYDASTDTPVSVHLEGKDASGTYIDMIICLNADETYDLSLGEYTLTAIASPIHEDGTMWAVSSEGQVAEVVKGSDVQTIVFADFGEMMPFEEITDLQIGASVKMATDCGMDEDAANALGAIAQEKRDAAVAEIEAEELRASTEASTKAAEKAKKAAKKAAKKSAKKSAK